MQNSDPCSRLTAAQIHESGVNTNIACFFQELEYFDRDSLTDEQLRQLGRIARCPHFAPESVREVSKACESLCRWVRALHEWCSVEPRLSAARQSEALARELRAELHRARRREEGARRRLRELELQLRLTHQRLEQQLVELRQHERVDKQAAAVVGHVKTHATGWKAAARVTRHTCHLVGCCC